MSPFHFLVATTAAVPLWVSFLRQDFPWYYFVSILAGELLLVFLSGLLSSFLLAPFTIASEARRCPKCGAPMFFAGQHFTSGGSDRPHYSDIVIFAVFIGLNVAVWITLLKNGL
ncbi:MAG TPA: hypothetical protein VGI88_09395 [Verrucomicrobiae bacterium]|jgi:hypothetical protein